MWSSRLFWKLVLVYGGFNFALAASFPLTLSRWEQSNVIQQVRVRLQDIAAMVKFQIDQPLVDGDRDELGKLVEQTARLTGVRITLIAENGDVIAESDTLVETMQNHSNREELAEARQAGQGDAIRRSATLGVPFLYYAIPVRRDGQVVAYVRVAEDVQTIESESRSRQRNLWGLAVAVALLGAPITYVLASRITKPLAELTASAQAIAAGDYEETITARSRDEVGALANAFSRMRKELRRRMSELEDQNQRMSTVLSSMVEGVMAVDSDRHVLLANQTCCTFLDINPADHVGRPLLEVARHAEIDDAVREALASTEPVQREVRTTTPPRRVLHVLVAQLPTEADPGAVIVLHDVTELRRLENLRRDFVANVSHELKTPLASIKAFAETLRLGAIHDAEHNTGFVDRICEQADMLDLLIADLLHLARVEAGTEAFQFGVTPLEDAAEQAVLQFRPLAEQKGITLQTIAEQEGVSAWADSEGLFTIVSNLLGNAVKYTPDKGSVTLRWRGEGQHAVLEVEDSGIGIAPEHQERVFERFFRVDKARSREQGGTGLGLAIVKHLAQAMGGSVELESEPGRGSVFSVRLPANPPS